MNCVKVTNQSDPARESKWLDLQMLWRLHKFQSKTLIVRLELGDKSELQKRLDRMKELEEHIHRIETELCVQSNPISWGKSYPEKYPINKVKRKTA